MDVTQKQDRATITDGLKRIVRDRDKEAAAKHLSDKKKSDAKKLKKRLQEAAERNESLTKAINDKNNEIADLRRSVQSLNDVLNSVPIDELRCNSSIASTKILELSQKNRQLRAELETTKNRVCKKDMQIQRLERELKTAGEKLHNEMDPTKKGTYAPISDLQNKLNSLQQRLFETRNRNVELQNQLKLAQKCLQQEVGDSFNLNALSSQSFQSNWRGRAQQIIHLQQRVHELRERLEQYEHHPTGRVPGMSCGCKAPVAVDSTTDVPSTPNTANGAETNVGTPHTTTGSTASFDRFMPGVRKSEILHRAKVEALEKEIANLQAQVEDQRNKILALKVRNKTLNDDVLKYKVKACSLEEQTDYNGVNMASMNEKLSVQKCHYENRLEELCREMAAVARQREEAQAKEEEMRAKMVNFESLLKNKDRQIEELNNNIKILETDLKAICGGFLFSCKELRKEEFIAILDALETEKNQLLELNKTLNARVNQERSKNDNLIEEIGKYKVRGSRLEAKIRDLEKELELQSERKKRTQRIAEYANSISATSLNNVASFTFENSSICSATSLGVPDEAAMQRQLLDLRNQLEVAMEKITMLQEKVTHLTEEKETDARIFDEILNTSKSIILDTIFQQKNCIKLEKEKDYVVRAECDKAE